ncbi:MAG: hypothetical protein A2V91_00975 [Candidatus Muproteobacteria bacterium RBG_16_64_10]|uniref:DUF3617 domain-containing protein n=1 Tax=Candidatus Muproteobacteria bacterium RBG_16_64_10 TaxID=1817757 RepID=A0A1F6T654_9PROT|nr:MAG: hypothetical protein A2V91_00975 [Candidatus Muproteobacteria bacterium RBG_16_64_10]
MRYLVSTLIVALAMSGLALADMPKRKPGLWEIKMTSDAGRGGGPMVSQHCIDAKTDDLLQQRTQGMGKQECSKNSVRREGGKVISESVCKLGDTTATMRAVMSGDFTSNYRGDIHSTYSPPMMGMKEARSTIEAKWLGACKAGQKPGDVIMPGAGNFNMNDMMKNLPKR